MIIGFTGSQNGMSHKQFCKVENLFQVKNELCIMLGEEYEFHYGDCIGADAQAYRIAKLYQLTTIAHPASDVPIHKHAYTDADKMLLAKPALDRNRDIVDVSKVIIACPNQYQDTLRSGTWMTIRYAKKVKKPLLVILPDGVVKIYNSRNFRKEKA